MFLKKVPVTVKHTDAAAWILFLFTIPFLVRDPKSVPLL